MIIFVLPASAFIGLFKKSLLIEHVACSIPATCGSTLGVRRRSGRPSDAALAPLLFMEPRQKMSRKPFLNIFSGFYRSKFSNHMLLN